MMFRVDVEAMLREKARGMRDVADLFDRAAALPEGEDRGNLLAAASERLSDVVALSRGAAIEGVARAGGKAPVAIVNEVWRLLVEKHGLSYADARAVALEVASHAE